ncbi:hypothetical protein KLEB273_gp088 [Bacillus phage vB_BauM_KLEB27-3]|nr:hypothetical protein KLEB273_gp088 [Bacillus phage vB_BauM_KLEB27-3]
MKIYLNKSKVELTMDEFLELLEKDALDDILDTLEDLEEIGKNISNFDEMKNSSLFDMFGPDFDPNSIEVYELNPGEDGLQMIDLTSDEHIDLIHDILNSSNEDNKVRRLSELFSRTLYDQ